MKKKFILLMMLFALFEVNMNVLNAQETITIGEGTIISSYAPFSDYGTAAYSLSQQLYLKEDINKESGIITHIAFQHKYGNYNTRDIIVYMSNVEKDSYSSVSDWVSVSNEHIVYAKEHTFESADWTTIELETPFDYTGNDICITINDKTGISKSYSGYDSFLSTQVDALRGFYATRASSDPAFDVSNLGDDMLSELKLKELKTGPWATPANVPYVNNIKFTFGVDDGLQPNAPTNLKATAEDYQSISLTWNAAENAQKYNVYQEGVKITTTTETSCIVTGLTPNTTYSFTVTGVRGSKESDHSASATATTEAAPVPAVPTNLVATANNHQSISLTWDAAQNAVQYKVYKDGAFLEATSETSCTAEALDAETNYCFTVTGVGVALNESEHSSQACATTLQVQDPFAGKQFRIKVANGSYAGYYLNVNSHEITDPYYYNEPDDAATRVGVSTLADSNVQIFTITSNDSGQYYLRDADGYLIKCDDRANYKGRNTWDIDAYSITLGTPLMFDYVDGEQFYIRDYDKYVGNGSSANYSTTNNYFKVQFGSVYCDAPINYYESDSHRTVLWTLEEVQPSVEVSVSTVALDDVRMGDFWIEEGKQKTAQFDVAVKYTTITNVSCDNVFFVVEYDANESVVNVGYNPEAEVTEAQSGTITITADGVDDIELQVSATPYTATVPDAIEAYTTIEFTDGEFTNTPTNLHDDYILPAEVNEGETPDAVYKFTLEYEGLVTVNVTGNNGVAAIYKAEDLEGNGPSSDNNYEGQVVPVLPTAPTTFFYDFNDGSLDDFDVFEYDANNSNWQYIEEYYGEKCIVSYSYMYDPYGSNSIGSADNYIYTKDKYLITADSKLSFDTRYYDTQYPDKVMVKVSTDGQEFKLIETVNPNSIYWVSKTVDLGSKFAELGLEYGEYHIALHHQEVYFERIFIDNFELTDGSAKDRATTPQINAVQYPAGTYYLVAAAEDEFTVTLSTSTLPAPEAITLIAPEDKAMEQDNPMLKWQLGNYTSEYQLLLGTTNPPTDVVVDWTATLANSYQTTELEVGTKYYWQVKAKNATSSVSSEVWSFVTPLNQVTDLTAESLQLYPGDETEISWDEVEGAIGYNIYINGEKVNGEEPITEYTYTLHSGLLDYNMNPGHEIAVTAVHELGESPKCDPIIVQVAGEFTLVVNVTDAEGNAIEGAAVAFNTEEYYDEYYKEISAVETLYTDANGQITQVLPLPCVYASPSWKFAQMEVSISKEYAVSQTVYINSYNEIGAGEEYNQDVTLQYVAPQNIQLDDYYNQYVVGEEMTMTWDAVDGAIGYKVYKRGELGYTLLTAEAFTDTEFTVKLTEYEPVYGVVYAVTAVYSFGESSKADKYVYVTGESQISAVVKKANDEALKGAIVTLTGEDDFGNNKTYEFITDANGAIADDVLVGDYTATISHYDYEDYVTEEFAIVYGTPYDLGTITLTTREEATIAVTATEAADGSKVDMSWEAEYEKYNVYRRNVETGEFVKLASNVTLNEYEATDWATLENGTYQYGVSAIVEQNLDYSEGFENGIPETWAVYNAKGIGSTFDWTTAETHADKASYDGTYAAYAKSSTTGNINNDYYYMVTDLIDLSNLTNAELSFAYHTPDYYYYSNPQSMYTNTLKVKILTEGNGQNSATPSVSHLWTNNKTHTSNWVLETLDLSSYAGQKIYVAFENYPYYGACSSVDAVKVSSHESMESSVVWSESITKSVVEFTNAAEDNDWHNAANWSTGEIPTAETNVIIAAAAVISSQNAVAKNITIASGASVTVNAERTLTAENIVNKAYSHSQLIINDGAQVIQNNEGVLATFKMGIVNPETWGVSADGWQFIAVPFTDAAFIDFTGFMQTNYDLFKYDGEAEDEWQNHKDSDGFGDAGFVNGRAYLASHENKEIATILGTLNNASSHTWELTYNAEKDLANFHLLGNPFSFDMDWSNMIPNNIYDGFAYVNEEGGYSYGKDNEDNIIKVGDGFFVLATDEDPSLSYGAAKRGNAKSESINLIATSNAGNDNLIISLDGAEDEGFNKLENFNKEIAEIYVANNGKRYAIMSYDENVTEIPVSFDAKQMGSYTINAIANGKFSSVILVDRFTGIETNLLIEGYSFTATGSDNHDRFIVKLVNGQQSTDNSQFAYISGEDLILNIEGSVQIIDVMGRVVYANDVTSDNNRINVSNFDNAAYMIRVVNENGVKVQKIIL